VPLAVPEGHRVRLEAFGPGNRKCGGRIQASAQKYDGFALLGVCQGYVIIDVRHNPRLY
jgi:hypothetical protein